ncbi:hypothetical protein V8Z80_19615 [Orrella sp. JC864]|uniref:hypothetical protein n=1 Tax=Orrella sp. JC864 TaxID=3120298 RepID=UPI00300ABC2B
MRPTLFPCLALPSRRRGAWLALGLAALAAAGCANIEQVEPGTPLAQVQGRFGAPTHACPLPDGGQRLVWSQQPYGQYAWGTRTTADGRVGPVEPILTDEYFKRLDQGHWTAERILCEFGPPAVIERVGMPSVRQVVWAYRYRENHVWNSLMHLYMGPDGTRLTRRHAAPDPMFEMNDSNSYD